MVAVKAAIYRGPRDIRVEDRPDPGVEQPTDAVVRVGLACVCGSDLWYWRGLTEHGYTGIGHELIGTVEAVGAAVSRVHEGDLVIVMGTGHHAAFSAGVAAGDTVAVVGDGAVGLCSVVAAKRLGAERVIVLSRNPARQALAREFGATDVVEERGDDAVEAVRAMTGGIGVDAALECVGTNEAITTALAIARPGSTVGYVGVPHGVELEVPTMFYRNVGIQGGPAPVRAYLPELLDDVLARRIEPGRVFDFEADLAHIADGYQAMDDRRSIKAVIQVSALEGT